MSDREATPKNLLLALVAAGAVVSALGLILAAAFPYIYAESGSARYAREHRGEAILQMIAAVVLLLIAWRCISSSLSNRTWLRISGILCAVFSLVSLTSYTRRPSGIRAIGGGFHVTVSQHPGEPDTVLYRLYHRSGPRYQPVQDLVSAYRYVAPDCVLFRGLRVMGRPMSAVCGHRVPVESYDTTIAESALLAKARQQKSFGPF